jgi:hypothetical protein
MQRHLAQALRTPGHRSGLFSGAHNVGVDVLHRRGWDRTTVLHDSENLEIQMRISNTLYRAAALALCVALAACSTLQPVPYAGVASSSKLRMNQSDTAGRMPYEYKAEINWSKYAAVIIDPVVIYEGSDNQFEKVSAENKTHLAQYMQVEFADKLNKRFKNSVLPGDDTLRIKLTLTGAKTNTAVLNTALHFDLFGGPYNIVQAARDKEGMMMGSVSFAVEIYDSSTNALLGAYVAKQYPNAWNLKAGMGAMTAAEVGVQKGADQLLAYLK